MIDKLFTFPLPFHLSLLVMLMLLLKAWNLRHAACGIPLAMVLGTTAVWYHGDALYNDYSEYQAIISESALEAGWWQVLWFLVALGFMVPAMHHLLNSGLQNQQSYFTKYLTTRRLEYPRVQERIDKLLQAMMIAWLLLMSVAIVRVEFNFLGLFAPYLSEKANPWGRGRIGGGFDAIFSLAINVQILLTAGFGVIAAVARNPSTQRKAILVCLLALPFFLFDRTRNTMLAVMLPGIMAMVLFRIKGGLINKSLVLVACFLLVNFWFSFVIANRSKGSIAGAFRNNPSIHKVEKKKHDGISMFSELGYMNQYFEKGTFSPSWGGRYFAEIVNPIPRALWKGKPLVGIDYAIARGFGTGNSTDPKGGVTATIATGMIGQGVVNFGPWGGPFAAATLMALWVSILARLDLLGSDPARLLLYAVGMILTFNIGRDITFLVLYPFAFGWMLIQFQDWRQRNMQHA